SLPAPVNRFRFRTPTSAVFLALGVVGAGASGHNTPTYNTLFARTSESRHVRATRRGNALTDAVDPRRPRAGHGPRDPRQPARGPAQRAGGGATPLAAPVGGRDGAGRPLAPRARLRAARRTGPRRHGRRLQGPPSGLAPAGGPENDPGRQPRPRRRPGALPHRG